jgi:hypothetical protein
MSSPHLCTCSIVAFETCCWGGNTTLGAYSKIILPRVSLPQLIFVPSQLVFVVLFSRDRAEKKFGEAARMSNLVRLSSILFETTKYHVPGAKDKVDLVGLLFSISLDDEFAAAPPKRARTDSYHTNTTGGWLHQISQAWAVHAHAPTYVPPVVADHFFPIISWCHRPGRGISNVRISTHRPR